MSIERSSESSYTRRVRVADAATIAEGFSGSVWGEAWGEAHLGRYLASKLTGIAGKTKPAIGVVTAVEVALYYYKESLGLPEPLSTRLAGRVGLRKGVIAEILGADAESVATIKETFADLQTEV